MKADLLLESSLKQLKLPCFAQSYQTLAQEAARTNLSYERYWLFRESGAARSLDRSEPRELSLCLQKMPEFREYRMFLLCL
jgi:hypothetical protein